MHYNKYNLGMSDDIKQMLLDGTAERSGGIIRRTDNKRIITWLRDADFENDPSLINGLKISIIPVALLGASFVAIHRRLTVIEDKLNQIHEKIDKVVSIVELSNSKSDGLLLGELNGQLQACALEITEGRSKNLIHYRRNFIEKFHSIRFILEQMLSKNNTIKDYPDVFHQYLLAMIFAGIAARDVSIYANELNSAKKISMDLCAEITKFEKCLTDLIRSPSALFWQRKDHLDIVKSVRESRDRVLGHNIALTEISSKHIKSFFLESQKHD